MLNILRVSKHTSAIRLIMLNLTNTCISLSWDRFLEKHFQDIPVSAENHQMALKRRMVSWLTALSGHCSWDDSVLIATMALIVVAEIFVPRLLWSPHGHSQSRKDDT